MGLPEEAQAATASNHPWLMNAMAPGAVVGGEQLKAPPPMSAPPPAPPPAAAPSQQQQLQQAFGGAYVPPKPAAPDPYSAIGSHENLREQGQIAQHTAALDDQQARHVDTAIAGFQEGVQDAGAAREQARTGEAKDQAELDAMRAVNEKRHEEAMGRIDAQSAKVRAMHVDPQKWYKDRGTAGSIFAALSIGAGAFAAGMPHSNGVNTALNIINQSIDRDIDAQKTDIDKAAKDLDWSGSQEDKRLVQDHFKEARKMEGKLDRYNHAIGQADFLLQRASDPEHVANLQNVRTGILKEKDKIASDYLNLRNQVGEQDQRAAAATAAAKAAEERRLADKERDMAIDLVKSGKVVSTDPNMPTDVAAAHMARATVRGDLASAGKGRVVNEGAAKEDAGGVDPGRNIAEEEEPKSTAWTLPGADKLQFTEANKNRAAQEVHNVNLLALGHKMGMRGEDAERTMKPLLIQSDDTQATIKEKRENALRLFGGKYESALNPAPGAKPGV